MTEPGVTSLASPSAPTAGPCGGVEFCGGTNMFAKFRADPSDAYRAPPTRCRGQAAHSGCPDGAGDCGCRSGRGLITLNPTANRCTRLRRTSRQPEDPKSPSLRYRLPVGPRLDRLSPPKIRASTLNRWNLETQQTLGRPALGDAATCRLTARATRSLKWPYGDYFTSGGCAIA
jgi:hypothetical protein